MQARAALTIEFVALRSIWNVQSELSYWRSWLRWLHRGHRQLASQAVRRLHVPAPEGKATALVHVLSGTIRAQAREAAMGSYRSRQTWVEPTVADDITTKNASAVDPARALVVLITNEATSLEPEDQ
jgi:hypothetical protein